MPILSRSLTWFVLIAVAAVAVVVVTVLWVLGPGESGENSKDLVKAGQPRPELDPQTKLPKDPEARRRMLVVKLAATNFATGGFSGGRSWPARIEDVLPRELEGRPVDPADYRLGPPADLSNGRFGVPVVYEAILTSANGYVGFGDGSVVWTSPDVIRKVLDKKN